MFNKANWWLPRWWFFRVDFSDKYIWKSENDFVKPLNLSYYIQYVDNTYAKKRRDETNNFYGALSFYHLNIKLSIEYKLRNGYQNNWSKKSR